MNKTNVKMNKLVYADLSILDVCKVTMYEHWYNSSKPKYGRKLCYTDTENWIVHVKSRDVYANFAVDVKTIFDTWTYEVGRSLSIHNKKQKMIRTMKDKLAGRIMKAQRSIVIW